MDMNKNEDVTISLAECECNDGTVCKGYTPRNYLPAACGDSKLWYQVSVDSQGKIESKIHCHIR
jgi:hypothetical protein